MLLFWFNDSVDNKLTTRIYFGGQCYSILLCEENKYYAGCLSTICFVDIVDIMWIILCMILKFKQTYDK